MMPRVLHAVDMFLSRSETFIYTYVTAHRHYDASVLCHARANGDEFPFPSIHAVPKPRSRRTMAWWTAAGIERVTGRSPWHRAVERLVDALQPSVLHAHFGPIGCEMVDIARVAGVPLVTSLYGVDAAVLPYLPRWRAAYDRLFETGALFLAEGPEMRKRIIAAGAPEARTAIQPIAIRLAKYPAWSPAARSSALFVGRFVEKKGLLDAIAAFARARARVPDATLTIVGGGPEEPASRAAVERFALGGCVEFAGMRSHADVIERLRRASVLIHPSVTGRDGDSEGGAPTILLEAQAIGTPIVTTRHADIPNVVLEGPGAYLCGEHDVDALADALVAAFERRERSNAAHVIAHHDVTRAVVRLEERYSEVAARSRRPAEMVCS